MRSIGSKLADQRPLIASFSHLNNKVISFELSGNFKILLNFQMNCITLTTTTNLFSKSEAIWPSNRSATWTNREICSFNGRVSFQWNFVSTRNTRVVGKRSTLWPVHYQHLCWHFECTCSCIHSNLNLCKCPVKLVTDAADISLCLTHVQLLLHWRMRGMWCSY